MMIEEQLDGSAGWARADAARLQQVVLNLLGNAVKFTPAGGAIRVAAHAAGNDAVVDVVDSGPGVPAEEHDAIFDSFFRRQNIPGAAPGVNQRTAETFVHFLS